MTSPNEFTGTPRWWLFLLVERDSCSLSTYGLRIGEFLTSLIPKVQRSTGIILFLGSRYQKGLNSRVYRLEWRIRKRELIIFSGMLISYDDVTTREVLKFNIFRPLIPLYSARKKKTPRVFLNC